TSTPIDTKISFLAIATSSPPDCRGDYGSQRAVTTGADPAAQEERRDSPGSSGIKRDRWDSPG
ncbi:MAG: hypothetical protein OXU21_12660, partial [Chloroflexota bacterium]|nr:hypothetical protein [Chloroflexota bacterium]